MFNFESIQKFLEDFQEHQKQVQHREELARKTHKVVIGRLAKDANHYTGKVNHENEAYDEWLDSLTLVMVADVIKLLGISVNKKFERELRKHPKRIMAAQAVAIAYLEHYYAHRQLGEIEQARS